MAVEQHPLARATMETTAAGVGVGAWVAQHLNYLSTAIAVIVGLASLVSIGLSIYLKFRQVKALNKDGK